MKKIISIISMISVIGLPIGGHAYKTRANSVFLMDYDSGAEIVGKNADKLMPPSSMIKLMTLAVLFEEIKAGNIGMNDRMIVSENADFNNPTWYPASKICLSAGQTLAVKDAITGIIVQSGGDASVVVAESLAGSESAFTTKMQKLARKIGMEESTFGNATGLPNEYNLMTSRELATLADYLITEHAELYPMFGTKRFAFSEYQDDWCKEWGRTHTVNYNKLLFTMNSADGMKTGHTDGGGYGMVASAKQNGRRLIAVVNGFKGKNHNELAAEVKKLLEYGYSSTSNKRFFEAGAEIVQIPTWYGADSNVVATTAKPFTVTLDKDQNAKEIIVQAKYKTPVIAPVSAGAVIGEISAKLNGEIIATAPLIAATDVDSVGMFGKLFKNISIMFGKVLGK